MNPLNTSTTNFADLSFGNPVLQSTFRQTQEEEQANGTRSSLNFADAASFK